MKFVISLLSALFFPAFGANMESPKKDKYIQLEEL